MLSRRQLIQAALATAAATTAAPVFAGTAATRIEKNPFELMGVASGDPTATGVVLWTRLALDLSDTERWGLPAEAYRLSWEVRPAGQPGARPVRTGAAVAARSRGYAVHVEVQGLKPGQRYAYAFRIGKYAAGGITRTAPAEGQTAERLRFCTCSCAEYENELYFTYDQMAKEEPDFIVHLGDYIYEETYDRFYKTGPDNRARKLRFDRERPLRTLADYRRRYAEHHTDPMLQRAHAAAPWIVTWDDHEVANDYAGGNSADPDEKGFLERRIAAYRAYFENLPIRLSTLPVRQGRRQLYRRLSFGKLMTLYMLDERQYRDPQACRFDNLPGGKNVGLAECPELSTNRSILGQAQEKWFEEQLTRSTSLWNVVAQGVMFSHLETRRDPRLKGASDPHMWNDTWSGYLPARQRMIDLFERHKHRSPVLFSGDIHAHFVNRVFKDWQKPGTGLVAPEFVCAAVSSFSRDLGNLVQDERNADVVAYYGGRTNGYVSCELTPKRLEATMVHVTGIDRQRGTATADRRARFYVEQGNPEPRRIPST